LVLESADEERARRQYCQKPAHGRSISVYSDDAGLFRITNFEEPVTEVVFSAAYHDRRGKATPARRWSNVALQWPQHPAAAVRTTWPVSSEAAAATPHPNAGVLRYTQFAPSYLTKEYCTSTGVRQSFSQA
jgi:hypothetical protein